MDTTTEIWYSVQNMGDGSAYPYWMESEELAKIDQQFMFEGWGEDCVGSITIKSNGPVIIVDRVETVDGAIDEVERELNGNWCKGGTRVNYENKLEALKALKATESEKS